MNYWDMALAASSARRLISWARLITQKLPHSMVKIKPGTAFLDKLLPLTNNAEQTVSLCTCPFSKMFSKYCYRISRQNKDGKSFIFLGLIWLSVVFEDLSISMMRAKNGFKPILEHHMQSLEFFKKKEEFLKSRKQKGKASHIWKFTWIDNRSRPKEKMQSENSWSTFKSISLQLMWKEEQSTLVAI